MKNPIQDLLDKAKGLLTPNLGVSPKFSDYLEDKIQELICLAFSRGVNMGGQNVTDHNICQLMRMVKDSERLGDLEPILDMFKETKEKLNKQKDAQSRK